MTFADLAQKLNEMVHAIAPKMPGDLIHFRIWGSHSHNTQMPESDTDFLGVYVAKNEDLLGLWPPKGTVDGNKPDYQIHEVGKFANLLLKGNPGILECLFTPEVICFNGDKWGDLRSQRRQFLTKTAVRQYAGYAKGQLERLVKGMSVHSKGGEPGEKWAYHLIRLLNDAKRILDGGEPVVWKDGAERDLLMQIRRGEIPVEEVRKMAISALTEVDSRIGTCGLPDVADEKYLNGWLLNVRGL